MAIHASSLALLLIAVLAHHGHAQLFNLPSLPSLSSLFPSAPCFGSSSIQSGVCRPSGQCSTTGHVEDGNCAPGFGVCCVTPQKCGSTSFTNNSIFASDAFPNATSSNASCAFKVTKLFNVVQLRVEFLSFEMEGPDASGHCSSDAFSVVGANKDFSLRICGKNSGQHVIIPVDASALNTITLKLDVSGRSPAKWQVKIIQIEASNANRAPDNCLQYFIGLKGTFESLNHELEGVAIAGLRYAACFRREANSCSIRFTPDAQSRTRRHAQQPYVNKYGAVLPNNHYGQRVQLKRPQVILRPAHVYRYPLVAVQPRPTPFHPHYDSPFMSSWYLKNSSSYVPPMAPGHASGSTVVLNTTAANLPTIANGTEDGNSTVTDGIETTTLNGTNSTDSYVAPIDDSIPSGFGACVGQDAVAFPPEDVLCLSSASSSSALRAVTLSVQPFAVYVDNRGSQPSKGFRFNFAHQAC